MHNKVVYHAMKALHSFGFPVLRFNFRGTGKSQGKHDEGRGEADDVRSALDWLDRQFHLPLIFAGFSFGAAVGLQPACQDSRVKTAIALGLPVSPVDERNYDFAFLRTCAKPKFFMSGGRDQFGPRATLEKLISSIPEPKTFLLIDDADHFFEGHLPGMREEIQRWISKTLELAKV